MPLGIGLAVTRKWSLPPDVPNSAAIWLAGQPNLAALWVSTVVLYVLSYEWFHLAYHLPADGLVADLVVDATGRGSSTPRWLDALGIGEGVEAAAPGALKKARDLARAVGVDGRNLRFSERSAVHRELIDVAKEWLRIIVPTAISD